MRLDEFTGHDRHMIRWEYRTLRRDGLTRPATRRTVLVLTCAGLNAPVRRDGRTAVSSRSPRPDPSLGPVGANPSIVPHGGAPEVAAGPAAATSRQLPHSWADRWTP